MQTEFTLDEINFLRWLLDQNTSKVDINIDRLLTPYQAKLLASVKAKLIGLSSY